MIRFWCKCGRPLQADGEDAGQAAGKGKAVAVFIFCIGFLVFPMVYLRVNGVRERQRDKSNLEQLAEAMEDYHDANGCLPAANAYPTRDGKSGLSWRVALLPYLGQYTLFQQFRLDEPWNSPHNLYLLPQMPEVYRIPGRKGDQPGWTYYQVFVGPDAVFQAGESPAAVPRLPGAAAP